MIRKIVILFIALLTVLSLTACGTASAYSGRGIVTGHRHVAMWIQTLFIPCGKSICPMLITHPEQWTLSIQHDGNANGSSSKDPAIVTYEVNKNSWENIEDGARVTITQGRIASYVNP